MVACLIADIGHLAATYYILGYLQFVDISKWNALAWGNIGVTVPSRTEQTQILAPILTFDSRHFYLYLEWHIYLVYLDQIKILLLYLKPRNASSFQGLEYTWKNILPQSNQRPKGYSFSLMYSGYSTLIRICVKHLNVKDLPWFIWAGLPLDGFYA